MGKVMETREILRVTTNKEGDVVACQDVKEGQPVYWEDTRELAGHVVSPKDATLPPAQSLPHPQAPPQP